jgi:hypothetical protein
VRQRSALAQVGSPAAHGKRSIFPRAVAEVSYSMQYLSTAIIKKLKH